MANQTQYDTALKNSGGDENNPMFQNWLRKYGGNNGVAAVPYGDLAGGVNSFMTNEAIQPFLKNLPNYAGMVGQRSANITSNLAGQLPPDVMRQIQQAGAERGVSSGIAGSGNVNAEMLRALGLNSLQLQQQGGQDLSAAIKDTPVPELFNPMSLYVPMTLGQQGLSAAKAGQAAGGYGGGYGGGGGGGGQISGLGQTPAIPRWNPGTVSGGSTARTGTGWGSGQSTQFDTAIPNSAYSDWNNTYGVAPQPAANSWSQDEADWYGFGNQPTTSWSQDEADFYGFGTPDNGGEGDLSYSQPWDDLSSYFE